MSEWAIEALDIAKRYRVGAVANYYPTIRETITNAAGRGAARAFGWFAGRGRAPKEMVWALDGVSFAIPPGVALGVIGRNGAGKSTLLRVLTRITRPTRGRVRLRGRVGSLLEVGAGFHPDLSGRENVFLNGVILGMSRADIRARFDEIVEFAGVGRYLDTAVKHYSSGMGLRLAFSIAAHLEPDILLVDEVLAVGDREFQRRCLGKIGDTAQSGRTVLFVSHDLAAVKALTSRALLLNQGRAMAMGPTAAVIEQYLAGLAPVGQRFQREQSLSTAHIEAVSLETSEPSHLQRHGQPFAVRVELGLPAELERPQLVIQVLSELQQPVTEMRFTEPDNWPASSDGRLVTCRLPALRLNAGRYTLRVELGSQVQARPVDQIDGVCPFEVTLAGLAFGWSLDSRAVTLESAEWTVDRG